MTESKLNRDIQEKLKPRKILSNLNSNLATKQAEFNRNMTMEETELTARQTLIQMSDRKKELERE